VPRNNVSGLKVSWGKFHDEISPPVVILLWNDILRGANMLLPLHNKVSVGDISGVTISTNGDFLEEGPLLRDTDCGCALLLRAAYGKFVYD